MILPTILRTILSGAVLGLAPSVSASTSTFVQSMARDGDARMGVLIADIPSFGLGTWLSDREKVANAVAFALRTGYRHLDAALIYRNEDEVGRGISESGLERSDFWVTSKLWNTDHRPENARAAIESSISDLGVDYLDLYLIHWPVAFKPGSGKGNHLDRKTSIVDTWRTLQELVRENRTRHIGISNFAPSDVEAILDICGDICPYAHEFETHPYLQQQEWVDWHQQRGIKVIAYSPLANTNPTYNPHVPAILDDPFWKALAASKNATVPQTILAWGLQRGTIVIPKSVQQDHITENQGALEITLTNKELEDIAQQDKKLRLNNPGGPWGVDLFDGLDDPTRARDGGMEL